MLGPINGPPDLNIPYSSTWLIETQPERRGLERIPEPLGAVRLKSELRDAESAAD